LQLAEYFAGARTAFDLAIGPRGSGFQERVWRALLAIPYGTTITYGELAREIGRPAASRAVGSANSRNPISIIVPCHRVIAASGELTGYAGGLAAKRWLIDHEQRVVQNVVATDKKMPAPSANIA
jgi:methylated-DNA-[protein]-cysteine S-methyltransferase